MNGGFLVQGDAYADEFLKGKGGADEGGVAVVGVQIEEVEDGFWRRVSESLSVCTLLGVARRRSVRTHDFRSRYS